MKKACIYLSGLPSELANIQSAPEKTSDSLQNLEPFDAWRTALILDEQCKLVESKSKFTQTAELFFDSGSGAYSEIGIALFEYSTLMDAFAGVQEARKLRKESEFEKSLTEFSRAAEILRATMHFGFLAGYVSGCAILEEAMRSQVTDERLETLRKAIALFEQSKLTLSFRDDKHAVITVIDSLLKYSISEALFAESRKTKNSQETRIKSAQARAVFSEYDLLAQKSGIDPMSIPYFPLEDWRRAKFTGFVVSFPENNSIWLGNIGCNSVKVETLGTKSINLIVEPHRSLSSVIDPRTKGRIRVVYTDLKQKKRYDEGCHLMI
ncbi:MAG: hypothetical protein JRN20_10180 [Nitrososphaerota archaeon]|nr:hypothetical protein [Nitrososphaerota archaeon]